MRDEHRLRSGLQCATNVMEKTMKFFVEHKRDMMRTLFSGLLFFAVLAPFVHAAQGDVVNFSLRPDASNSKKFDVIAIPNYTDASGSDTKLFAFTVTAKVPQDIAVTYSYTLGLPGILFSTSNETPSGGSDTYHWSSFNLSSGTDISHNNDVPIHLYSFELGEDCQSGESISLMVNDSKPDELEPTYLQSYTARIPGESEARTIYGANVDAGDGSYKASWACPLDSDPGADNDGDYLTNAQEAQLGTDPNNADTDGDDVEDGAEVGVISIQATLPDPLPDADSDTIIDALEHNTLDSDGDGTPNHQDTDSDGDEVPDSSEYGDGPKPRDTDGDTIPDVLESNTADADGDSTPNHQDTDSDGDDVSDSAEAGSTPYEPLDSDGDNVPDYLESNTLDTDNDGSVNYQDSDADDDGIDDGIEDSNRNGVVDTGEDDPLDACSPNDSHAACLNPEGDDDGDGLTNGQEAALGTDPKNADTDGDGLSDALEVGEAYKNSGNKEDALDYDKDGVIDALEHNTLDSDGDGDPNYNDLDSDNDGMEDGVEVGDGPRLRDTDGDLIPDILESSTADTDDDGVKDDADPANDDPCVPNNKSAACDTDKDGVPDGDDEAPNNPCVPSLEAEACAKDAADISVTSSVEGLGESGLVKAGEVFSLVSMTKNKGAAVARNVRTEHKIPASLEREGAPEVDQGGSCQVTEASGSEPLIVTCTWPTLAVGEAARVTVKLKMPAVTAE